MRLKALCIAMLMVFIAMEAGAESKVGAYSIETVENHARVKSFRYQSYDECYLDAGDRANSERLTRQKTDEILSLVPKGGAVVVELLGAEWRMANGTNWTFIVADQSGNLLFRSKGHHYIEPPPAFETTKTVVKTRHRVIVKHEERAVAPEKTAFGDRVYVVSDTIEIPVALPATFKVIVLDNINNKRCTWVLTKTGY
ncbi:hypothetical protein [Chlorobium sp. KB01]|uniref:hypothetical protein n=1 Tax=Chlorobium sp. KB01 TaxID=1917528 RepID=UPI0009781977|nr:hypothetical protein [Chlorobium sp. KB01]